MRDFFKPWRRKIGVVSLVLACVLMLAHVRSSSVSDFIEAGCFGDDSFVFGNTRGTIGLMIVRIGHNNTSTFDWFTEQPGATDGHSRTLRMVRKNGGGFTFWGLAYYLWKSDSNRGPMTMRLVEFKSLLVVIPLTLISTFLLLSNRPPAAPQQSSEPAPTTGTAHA